MKALILVNRVNPIDRKPGGRMGLEVVLVLNNIEKGTLEEAAFTVENGELKSVPVKEGFTGRFLHIIQNAPSQPLLVFDSGKHLFLAELWNVLRPDRTWNGVPGEDAFETFCRILQELWLEARQLGLTVLHDAIPLLLPEDPLLGFLDAASEGLILETVPDTRADLEIEPDLEPVLEFSRDQVVNTLGPNGLLSENMKSYCYRPAQEEMAREVCAALEQDEFLLAEAGTGVGKTLAYLVPSIYWALAHQEKMVISTRTKALQRQLAEKDLPLLADLLPVSFNWRIAYGRDNYLCLARWYSLKHNPVDLSPEERRLMVGLCIWLARGGEGELQDLRWDSQGGSLWKRINCQRHGCTGNLCSWYHQCYFFVARRKLNKADIIVVNHALLLSDTATENSILPSYRRLVIDEAHNLERAAFEKLGNSFSVDEGMWLLGRLSEKRQGIDRGYLISLKARYPQYLKELTKAAHLVDLARHCLQNLAACDIAGVVGSLGARRIKPGMRGAEKLSRECRRMAVALNDVQSSLQEIAPLLADDGEELTLIGLAGEVGEKSSNLWMIAESLDSESDEMVVWVETDSNGLSLVAAAPLDIGRELTQLLYPGLSSLIMVSATLTVGGSFQYMKRRLGLDHLEPERIREWTSPSPFDFERNCRTLAVRDLAEPGSSGYAEMIARCIKTIAGTVRRRTLVLFTAKSLLLQTANLLREEGSELSERLICQYQDGDYGTLVARLAARPDGLLLGSEVFWEGVDLPGDMLNCLVLTRLPFRPPTEPLVEAWTELLTRQGRNAFQEYSLAEAVIRFRQGTGRLIRSEIDSGVVVVLDRRFCHPPSGRAYSSLFRESMPAHSIIEIGHAELDRELTRWFAGSK